MKTGVPGFCGARLREGREARDMAVLTLSELVGVSRQSIHSYEGGEQAPQIPVLSRIAQHLNLPVRFFTLPARVDLPKAPNYRARAATTVSEKKRVWWRYRWFADIVEHLSQWVEFPYIDSALNVPDDYDRYTDDQVERLASDLRRTWDLGSDPVDNLIWLLESKGTFVGRDDSDVEHVFAMSRWLDGRPQMLLQTGATSTVRDRLNAAHELYHIIAGHDPASDEGISKTLARRRETQAMRFATAFLFPASAFADTFTLPSLDAFAARKAQWGLSIGAQIKRARDLDFISEAEERRLWINYTRRGYREREPLDDQIRPELPALLPQAIDAVVDAGLTTKERLVDDLARAPIDIERLAGLPEGSLRSEPPKPRLRVVPRATG